MPHTPASSPFPAAPEDLYSALCERAQEPPPALSRALYIAGRRCGHATLAACDALQGRADIRVEREALRLGEGMAPGAGLDALLAGVAATLREADCLRGWRDELLDIHDGDGARMGAMERAAVRPLGILTRAVHLNAWTPDGHLWVARRALNKATDPGLWDTLVGGLVASGESPDLALTRECEEEAGLAPHDIRHRAPMRAVLRMRRRLPEGYQVEDLLVSRCVLDAGVRPSNRDGEVMEFATVTPEHACAMAASGELTLEAALVVVSDIANRFAA